MLCKDYRKELTDVAASGCALSGQLQDHVEACVACREFFAQEHQLFAAIDSGVRLKANAEVPASLLTRVRARLHEQPVRRRSWLPASVVCATAAMVLTAVIVSRVEHRESAPNSGLSTAARHSRAVDVPTVVASGVSVGKEAVRRARGRARQEGHRPVNPAGVRVLLPAGQKEAVDTLLVALRTGTVKGEVLAAEDSERPSRDKAIPALAIAPIDIKPLASVSEESAPEKEETKR